MWKSSEMIALYIVLGLIVFVVLALLMALKAVRSRTKMQKILEADPDMGDWLIIFNWTPKVLYVPTILFSLIASFLMFLKEADMPLFDGISPEWVGGVWFCIFLLNFLIEEYDITIKAILVFLLCVGCFMFWLQLWNAVPGFFVLVSHLALSISGMGYLLLSLFGGLTILVSWLRGLFHYYTLTPNYMNIQRGLTEAGEQIDRRDYLTRIDTSDFCERLLGFGKIIISYRDKERSPETLLVWRIQQKARDLERTHAKLAIDFPAQQTVSTQNAQPAATDTPAADGPPNDET